MAKQIIRLTESDLHRIIKESVNRIIREEDNRDWTDDYNDWADFKYKDSDEAGKLNRSWTKKVKEKYPDPKERRSAISKHMKTRDVEKGKTKDNKYWRDYDRDMNDE